MNVASRWRVASIAPHDAMILPHRANLPGWNFRERQAVKALIVANDFLEVQLEELRAKVSTGYARGRLPSTRKRKDEADV
jgi:hypothetical protein